MKKKLSLFAVFVFFVMILASCSTTIHATIERPAELDLNGAKTMAVLPFQVDDNSMGGFQTVLVFGDITNFFNKLNNSQNGSSDAANYLTRQLEQGITGSRYVELVYSDAVKGALDSGRKAPCDVYLTGYITKYNNEIKETKHTVKVDGKDVKVPYYHREVSFTLTYQIVDSETNRVISSKYSDIYASSEELEKPEELPDPMKTIRSELDGRVAAIMRQIQPYTETKYISLLKDKSKDPDMKTADKYVKNGLLDAGRELYLKLYQTRGYFEAGYNAAIILEAQGYYEEAYEEMDELVRRFGDKRAVSALNDILYEMNSRQTLQQQLER